MLADTTALNPYKKQNFLMFLLGYLPYFFAVIKRMMAAVTSFMALSIAVFQLSADSY